MSRTGLRPDIDAYKNVHWYQCDISDYDRVAAVASQIRKIHGDPTVLVNNAAITSKKTILEQDQAELQKITNINLLSHWKLLQEFLPAMITKNHGHVVSIGSLGGFVSVGGLGAYGSMKSALLSVHETLRQELRHIYKANKVRTSIVNPGWTTTPMMEKEWELALKTRGTPLLKCDDAVLPIVDVILGGYSCGPLVIPGFFSPLAGLQGWPTWAKEMVVNYGQVAV
ncbi:hypothetical protein ABW20_dc0102352 [Dactylellina cionopaga]|nr:hypothetical protein ABW20_dc0102352 [Dactylellina cionopaga]